MKTSKAYRLSDAALHNLTAITTISGCNETAAIEISLAHFAQSLKGIKSMTTNLTPTEVIARLSVITTPNDEWERQIKNLNELVEPLCKTQTYNDEGTDEHTHLYDWLYEGEYKLTDTPKTIAEDWDEIGIDAALDRLTELGYSWDKLTREQAAELLGEKAVNLLDYENCEYYTGDEYQEWTAHLRIGRSATHLTAHYFVTSEELDKNSDDLTLIDWKIDHYSIY